MHRGFCIPIPELGCEKIRTEATIASGTHMEQSALLAEHT